MRKIGILCACEKELNPYIADMQDICKRQVLSSKKWQLISSFFWQLSTSILYTPTDCSVGIFLLERKFYFFHSL